VQNSAGPSFIPVQDATIACAYAQLTAVELGLGTVRAGAFDDAEVSRILNTKTEWRSVALLPIGYPAESPEPTPRRPLEELVKDANPG
jgi:nitroreductase